MSQHHLAMDVKALHQKKVTVSRSCRMQPMCGDRGPLHMDGTGVLQSQVKGNIKLGTGDTLPI